MQCTTPVSVIRISIYIFLDPLLIWFPPFQPIALIPLVRIMVSVWRANACVRKAGKEIPATKWMRKQDNAFQIVMVTVDLIWNLKCVTAHQAGRDKVVPSESAIWTVGNMEGKRKQSTKDGGSRFPLF